MSRLSCFIFLLLLAGLILAPRQSTAQAVTTPAVNVDEGGRAAPTETLDYSATEKLSEEIKPFGANLFRGRFITEREDGLNPGYVIQQGDTINLRIWGAIEVSEVVTVDAQGNIFIPNVGPIQVAGITNGQLNTRIRSALGRVYTQNVNVYTNLAAATPVIVFVTGFVNNPGSFAGLASDSVLYFLDRAGGVDNQRGSYLDISIIRNGEVIGSVNLYDFLINGSIPKPQFIDGDTILVKQRGPSLTVDGSVMNSYNFEIPKEGMSGEELINLARPNPNAFYATVIGTRNDQPYSAYIPVSELRNQTFYDGDLITFEVDTFNGTMIIRVQGSHTGQSRFVVPRNTHLKEVLDYIQVNPALSDINSISIRRDSIRIRQARALQESLTRLQTAVLSKQSLTAEGANLTIREADLISNFVDRAKDIKPEGILVVSHDGTINDILLQPNDIINIPDNTNIIQVSGEVSVPQAMVYKPDYDLEDYINMVGGYTERADKSKHLIIRRTGEVVPLFNGTKRVHIRPGDEIISMPKIPTRAIEIVQLVVETMFRVASSAAIFLTL